MKKFVHSSCYRFFGCLFPENRPGRNRFFTTGDFRFTRGSCKSASLNRLRSLKHSSKGFLHAPMARI